MALPHTSRSGTLASRGGTWQGTVMVSPPRPTAAGGALIAFGALGGAAIGFLLGEATPGFLIGTALGVLASLLIWLNDRRARR